MQDSDRQKLDRLGALERQVAFLYRVVYLLATHRHEYGRVVADGEPEERPLGTVDEVLRGALVAALESTGGNKRQAARKLDVNVKTLYNWIAKYGVKL